MLKFFWHINFEPILLKIFMNANNIKTQLFHQMVKCHFYVSDRFCDYNLNLVLVYFAINLKSFFLLLNNRDRQRKYKQCI